jgi:AraC family transcriptional regulator
MMPLVPPPSFTRFLGELDALLRATGIAPRGGVSRRSLVPFCSLDVSPRIRRVQNFVEVHVGEALCLDDLADVAGLSRYHFSRVFREEVGQTPWTFVRHTRIRRATELLTEGRPPAEVAHETGFADQSHLTRVLRKIDGRTPGEIREAPSENRESDRKIVQDT